MRALLAVAAAAALVVLSGCGAEEPVSLGNAPVTERVTPPPSKTPPPAPTPTDIVPPTEAGKPLNPGGAGEPPVTIGPSGPVVPAGVTELPATQVDASALPNYFEYGNRVWSYQGGLSLQMFAAASSSCSGVEALVVDQSADAVKITVWPMDGPQGGRPDDGACAMVMTPTPVTVTLDSPLKDRKVLLGPGR